MRVALNPNNRNHGLSEFIKVGIHGVAIGHGTFLGTREGATGVGANAHAIGGQSVVWVIIPQPKISLLL